MKKVIFLMGVLTLSLSSYAEVDCETQAEEAVRAIYSVTDTAKVELSANLTNEKYNQSLNEDVEVYSVNLKVNGGSGVYSVETVPTLGCLISKVELQSHD